MSGFTFTFLFAGQLVTTVISTFRPLESVDSREKLAF